MYQTEPTGHEYIDFKALNKSYIDARKSYTQGNGSFIGEKMLPSP